MKTLLTSLAVGLCLSVGLSACGDKAPAVSSTVSSAGLSADSSAHSSAHSSADSSAAAAPAAAFINADLTGANYAQDFALTDHNGKPRTLADFKGKLVVMFFGYTQCPDVCPTTMAEMANVMKQLGAQANLVQVLFVTVDPARDTQDLLAHYVPAFDARFLGLYGDAAATAKVAKEFKVFYAKVEGQSADSYSMDHTAGSYVFDRNGKLRLFLRHGQGADPIVHDLQLLLR